MFARNALQKFPRLFLVGLAFLSLLMSSSASSWGQGKNGGKKASEKTANTQASEQGTVLIISPDHKSAKLKPGSTAKRIGRNEVLVTGVLNGKIVKKTVSCNCTKFEDPRRPGGVCEVRGGDPQRGEGFDFTCTASGGCANCDLHLDNVPIKQ